MKIGVVISTYNKPDYLRLALAGYLNQIRKADEIIIADDGSTDDTRFLIENYKSLLPIKHVWHEDNGFQKSVILNKALLAAESEYLIFTDQDCVPRSDFVAVHERYAQKGCYLSAGCYRLTENVSGKINEKLIDSGEAFDWKCLRTLGLPFSLKLLKLTKCVFLQKLANCLTPTKKTFNGCNSSAFKVDILAVNGFDETMHYGGQDREMGYRLVNSGIRPKMVRYYAVCLHLYHNRPYKTKESVLYNKCVMKTTQTKHIQRTCNGLETSVGDKL